MAQERLGTIAFVLDERIARERMRVVTRVVNSLRQIAQVDLWPGYITEDEVLARLTAKTYSLVLVPWYRYMSWSRVEALYGLTRTSGPTFAGYFSDQLLPYELGEQADHLRAILLDFGNQTAVETAQLVRTLIQDHRRAGLRPLLEPGTPVYCENWYGPQGLGARMEAVLGLPEIANSEWSKRANAIRIVLTALQSLIYDEGPGKSELSQAISSKAPRAYLQLGVDGLCLAFRLCYSLPNWSPKDALAAFWPDDKRPSAAAQLLLRYADFTRLHKIADTQDIELVTGFFPSAPAERSPGKVHTLWVEPIAQNLVTEPAFEAPGPTAPHLKALPVPGPSDAKPRSVDDADSAKSKERFLFDAAVKIRKLREQLAEREEMIRELRSGGVGTAPPLPPPDTEALLEAFQERYFEARFQIRQFELQIADAEKRGAQPHELEQLRQKMAALANREQAWIKRIASTLEAHRKRG